MRITEDCINHNALRLIDENTMPFEFADETDLEDHQRLVTLGYIRGVLDFAKTMKEVLKA